VRRPLREDRSSRKPVKRKGSELRRRCISLTATLLCALLFAACGEDSPDEHPVSAKDFDPANFDQPTEIDNKWLPLKPGTQFVYEGSSIVDERRESHRVVFTVTDLTKVVEGVSTVVGWDRDYSADELVEAELVFFAQDNDGNVWQMGQYPEEYEHGKLVDAPTWIAGLKGARAGIAIRAEPRVGAPSYSQGYAPRPISYVDHGKVFRTGQRTCVPVRCYGDVLVTEEFEPNKPGAYQLKYYSPIVGNVRVGWRGPKEDEKEKLVLVDLVHLNQAALAKVRAQALELEKRAYRVSKDVYGKTPPAEPLGFE
jgi:hypothetical protein